MEKTSRPFIDSVFRISHEAVATFLWRVSSNGSLRPITKQFEHVTVPWNCSEFQPNVDKNLINTQLDREWNLHLMKFNLHINIRYNCSFFFLCKKKQVTCNLLQFESNLQSSSISRFYFKEKPTEIFMYRTQTPLCDKLKYPCHSYAKSSRTWLLDLKIQFQGNSSIISSI